MKTYQSFKSLILAVSSVVVVNASAGETPDPRAEYWRARKSAVMGDASAQWEVAKRFEKGQGVSADLGKAIRWYLKAAEHGNMEAQYRLGQLYSDGEGLTQSDTSALAWYRKAAAQGHTRAMNRIGVHYKNGWGVTRDLEEANKWFASAARDGDVSSVANLKATQKELTGGVALAME